MEQRCSISGVSAQSDRESDRELCTCLLNPIEVICAHCNLDFCSSCWLKHRNELDYITYTIKQQYQYFIKSLQQLSDGDYSNGHPAMLAIDEWENIHLQRIHSFGEEARAKVQHLIRNNRDGIQHEYLTLIEACEQHRLSLTGNEQVIKDLQIKGENLQVKSRQVDHVDVNTQQYDFTTAFTFTTRRRHSDVKISDQYAKRLSSEVSDSKKRPDALTALGTLFKRTSKHKQQTIQRQSN
ncbi:unnamed protein product [Didymodactylos carnosus]|uniref:Uncharacterized protein n=1 Tax=Didymodactylos carnosus TaxID=1234261 RepID=A0A813YVY2_9BILA|nr:unnamed protein product [Didymodactylos carnosus]CAF0889810.1 unnamed protein product [Didymodactylos carnosus]CAF3564141.1 unnamed protein product [Didymodactylos carnosus]CAF3674353.1 unnamed protein product [Didymodactylos carnosus]